MAAYQGRGLHGQIVEQIGVRIVGGSYAPGTILFADVLEQTFDVSKTVVREALKVLAAKGLVESRPKRGTVVLPRRAWSLLDADVLRWQHGEQPDFSFLKYVAEMRTIIEPAGARRAAERRTEDDLKVMQRALDAMSAGHDEPEAVVAADVQFHRALLDSAHNELLSRMEVVLAAETQVRDRFLHHSKNGADATRAHQAVFDAIRESDAELAGKTMEALLAQADADLAEVQALVEKSALDGAVMFDQVLQSNAERGTTAASALRRALERQEFLVYYQPIVDLTTATMVSAEALLRWKRADRELVTPDEFLSMADATGLIVPIGAWALEQACRQLADWQRTDPSMSVAVNLSERQLLEPDIAALIEDVLGRTQVRPGSLYLELNEGVFSGDAFAGTVADLKRLGVRLTIEDFGTGSSSLSYLKDCPVDGVKVDRTFVEGLGTNPHQSALVAALIAMADAFDLAVTAEGVESQDQLTILKNLHCRRAQGFLLAKPMSADAINRLVAESHRWQVD
jgi:GntR family galactonate operon transcriptional repressor